jgi:hypothetical protein
MCRKQTKAQSREDHCGARETWLGHSSHCGIGEMSDALYIPLGKEVNHQNWLVRKILGEPKVAIYNWPRHT